MYINFSPSNLREIKPLEKKRVFWSLVFTLFMLVWIAEETHAFQVKVLHTNDLHGFIEHTDSHREIGGFARLKYKMDSLEQLADDRGVPTVRLDAGDFMEGSLFYTVNEGADLMKLMEMMDYDAVAVGNHDFQMGTKELNALMASVSENFHYLAANMSVRRKFRKHLPFLQKIKPYRMITVGHKKIAILGVTTNEAFYRWQFKMGRIDDPVKTVEHFSKLLKEDLGADQVWVLSHVGKEKDIEIAKKSRFVDLIIGGHSHTLIPKPLVIRNRRREKVYVVQAGSLGRFLGDMTIDINESDNRLTLVDYKQHEVKNTEADPEIASFVSKMRMELNLKYGESYLSEVVGHTHKPLIQSDYRYTQWTQTIADGIKNSTDADASLYSPHFKGANIQIGDISREDIMMAHPRFFSAKDMWGWRVYTLEIDGFLLTRILKEALQRDFPLAFSGVEIHVEKNGQHINPPLVQEIRNVEEFTLLEMMDRKKSLGRFYDLLGEDRVHKLKINGEKIYNFRKYKIAVNEAMAVGGLKIGQLLFETLTMNVQKTDKTVWQAIESEVKNKF